MIIKVLGPGCANCVRLEKNAKEAIEKIGIDAVVVKIQDMKDIAKYGILRTPGLVIDDKLVSYGKVNTVEEIVEFLK